MKSGLACIFLFFLGSGLSFAQTVQSQQPDTGGAGAAKATASGTRQAKAQESQEDSAAAHKQQVIDLLERSHAANEEVQPDQKAALLARQISMFPD